MGERSLLIIGANSVTIKRHTHAGRYAVTQATNAGAGGARELPSYTCCAYVAAQWMARIVWALMAPGGVYKSPAAAA